MPVALALERYHAIRSPMEYRVRATTNMTKRLIWYVMPVLFLATIYYIPRFFDLYVEEVLKCNDSDNTINTKDTKEYNASSRDDQNCTFEYQLGATNMRIDYNYVLWYINISNFLLTALIPVGVLSYINCKIHSSLHNFMARRPSAFGIRQNHQAREQRASDVKQVFILFSIVIILVICHSLRVVLNVEEFIDLTSYKEQMEKGCNGREFWHEVLVRISQLLIIINSSANFFIYVFMDNGFRNVLRRIGVKAHNNNFNIGISTPTRTGITEDRRKSRSNDMELLNINDNNN